MDRRDVLKGGIASAMTASTSITSDAAIQGGNHFYELRTYDLRNDLNPTRIHEFFQRLYVPFLKRSGVGPVGSFNVISGHISPALILLIDYPSLSVMQSVAERALTDKDLTAGWKTFETQELGYVRYESVLLKAFDGHQKIEVPETAEKRPGRVFELRTYESRNAFTLRDKITMFNQEEIKIFRDSGFAPVFFGEGMIAPRLPHLTYLVGFDNMAAREKCWDAFRTNPDWARVRVKPGWTDAEAVSNSIASFLRPTAFSEIR